MTEQKNKGKLIKKAIALTLGLTMALGGLMLPNKIAKNSFIAAHAEETEINGCTYSYDIEKENDIQFASVTGIKGHGETVEIPSVINHGGVDYPVQTIKTGFLKDDTTVKNNIFPESVKRISSSVLYNSSVENITLPEGLEHLGVCFAGECHELRSVDYNGTSIKGGDMEWNIFSGSELSGIINDKGAVCLGNWIVKYLPPEGTDSIKVADLGNDGIKIENVGYDVFDSFKELKSADLGGAA